MGKTGTVVDILGDGDIGVSFDDWDDGHTCNGCCPDDTGRYGNANELELFSSVNNMNYLRENNLNAELKTLIEEGFLDTSLQLTNGGREFLLQFLMSANLKELATFVEAKRKEREKKAK